MEETKDISEIKEEINKDLDKEETTILHQEGSENFPDIEEGNDDDDDEVGLIITKKETSNPPKKPISKNEDTYDGKGVVIQGPVKKQQGETGIKTGALANPERVDSIKQTFKEMDSQIAEAKAKAEKHYAEEKAKANLVIRLK